MKNFLLKTPVATLIIGALFTGNTFAAGNSGEMQFIGSVTDTTCDIVPEINGSQKSTIDLGSIDTSGAGAKAVDFNLVPQDVACLAKTDADVSWQSAGFNNYGLSNTSGSATGVAIELKAINAVTANDLVTSNHQTIAFSDTGGAEGGIDAFKFEAKLTPTAGTVSAGSVIANATYSVAYK